MNKLKTECVGKGKCQKIIFNYLITESDRARLNLSMGPYCSTLYATVNVSQYTYYFRSLNDICYRKTKLFQCCGN